jgi:hypothetical protein
MHWEMPGPPIQHIRGVPADGSAEIVATTTASRNAEGMGGMEGTPPDVDAVAARGELICDHCGRPADHQPLQQIGDGERLAWLHRRCEVGWLQA